MNKTVKRKRENDNKGKGLFRQSFFSCLKFSQFISLHFKYHRYFYNGSENNKLESGESRVNMLTWRLPFPCIDYVLPCVNILAPRTHGSGNMETGIPERKPPLIGLITIHKKIERMSSPEPLCRA